MMTAYHGDPALKESVLAELRAHRAADEIVQGLYWDAGQHRGCAVGCLTHDPDGGHAQYPERWGIPEHLAWLEDRIFELLPLEQARDWPLRFMEAIPVGADLSLVWPRFAVWLLTDPQHGAVNVASKEAAPAIRAVAALYERRIRGDEPSEAEWQATWAARAARAARAAWEAAEATWAARAAWEAAEAAEAARAAWAEALWAAQAARAVAAAWADTLVRLCAAAPMAVVA